MTADPATRSTHLGVTPFSPTAPGHLHAAYHGMHLLPDTRGGGPRGPHPADILYWVACLGGACLLLFMAT